MKKYEKIKTKLTKRKKAKPKIYSHSSKTSAKIQLKLKFFPPCFISILKYFFKILAKVSNYQ